MRAPLKGKKVLIRNFTRLDISETYVSWLNDQSLMAFSNQRFKKHTLASCIRYLEVFSGTDDYFLAIIDSESGDLVGTITVYFSIEHRTADVGLMLGHKDYRGRGYGTEAWMLTLDYLMTEVRVRKATAGTLRNNFGMIRIIETSDMKLEGTRVKQEIVGGEPMDILQFAKFRE